MREQLGVVLALWEDGVIPAEKVVEWADRQIEHAETSALPAWLMELSLHGPVACFKNPLIRLPQSAELSFLDRFAVRVVALNQNNTEQIETFVAWAARTAIGEDHELPEVELSYELDHLANACEMMESAVAKVRKELPALRDKLKMRAESLLSAV